MSIPIRRMSPAEKNQLLDQEVSDRNYITQAQVKLINELLGRHDMYDWTDFQEVCREAFCESTRPGMELAPDQIQWTDLTTPQASAVIDYLKASQPQRNRRDREESWE